MPLFITDDEYTRCSHNPSLITKKADSFIKNLYNRQETEKAQFDANWLTAKTTCDSLLLKYVSLQGKFDLILKRCDDLKSAENRLAELAKAKNPSVGDIQRLSLESSELTETKNRLLRLIADKDLLIKEQTSTITRFIDKIADLTDTDSESRISELEANHLRIEASLAQLSEEKELVDKHNEWLNEQLALKVESFLNLKEVHDELQADLSAKTVELECLQGECNDTYSSLKAKDMQVKELESKLENLKNDLSLSKDDAAAMEERLLAELLTSRKLVELIQEESDEWSKKAGELQGDITYLETHLSQVEKDFKEQIDEVSRLEEKLNESKAELEKYGHSERGKAAATSVLEEGWSAYNSYKKYEMASDALKVAEKSRREAESALECLKGNIQQESYVVDEERATHKRALDAYNSVCANLANAILIDDALKRDIQELKYELKRHERDYSLLQKYSSGLQNQVDVLLKECVELQTRGGGSSSCDLSSGNKLNVSSDDDGDDRLDEQLLPFKDIKGLVEQNGHLHRLVLVLKEQLEGKEKEVKESSDEQNLIALTPLEATSASASSTRIC